MFLWFGSLKAPRHQSFRTTMNVAASKGSSALAHHNSYMFECMPMHISASYRSLVCCSSNQASYSPLQDSLGCTPSDPPRLHQSLDENQESRNSVSSQRIIARTLCARISSEASSKRSDMIKSTSGKVSSWRFLSIALSTSIFRTV